MTLTWPWMLPGLLAVPALVLGHRRLLARRAARRARLAQLGLVTAAAGARHAADGRRHVAPVLFLLAFTLLLLALTRPMATIAEPRREGTVVLAFDTSNSMAATDVEPSRMAAAQAAARTFVERQPSQIRIAVVAFGDTAVITQQPTTDHTAVLAAIDRLVPAGGTALGRGLQSALTAIVGRPVILNGDDQTSDPSGGSAGGSSDGSVEASGPDLGYTRSAAVVLLSDGENTGRLDPSTVADVASLTGIRIYPIGLGSPQGTVVDIDGYQVATALDEASLRRIAEVTDGAYFAAADAEALQRVYSSIDLQWTIAPHPVEITALLSAAAAILVLLGAGLSWRWFGRVI